MTFKLGRPKADMVRKSCLYKSLISGMNQETKRGHFKALILLKSHLSVF